MAYENYANANSAALSKGSIAAVATRSSDSLVSQACKNSERTQQLANRLNDFAARLCGGGSSGKASLSAEQAPGFNGKMASVNSEISDALSSCEEALSRIESFV